jgi:hypothetical protein
MYISKFTFQNVILNPKYPGKNQPYLKQEKIVSNVEGKHPSCQHSFGLENQTIVFQKKLIN